MKTEILGAMIGITLIPYILSYWSFTIVGDAVRGNNGAH